MKLFNSYYYTRKFERDSNLYIGLIDLENNYPYENEYLHSGFNRSFKLPDGARLALDSDSGFRVNDIVHSGTKW